MWSLEKTVSIGRNQQFKLSRKRFALSLPPACGHAGGGSKAPAHVIGLAAAAPAGAGAAGRRLWAALDSGWVLQLRSGSGKPERVLDTKVRGWAGWGTLLLMLRYALKQTHVGAQRMTAQPTVPHTMMDGCPRRWAGCWGLLPRPSC